MLIPQDSCVRTAHQIYPDWLSVSMSVERFPLSEVRDLLYNAGFYDSSQRKPGVLAQLACNASKPFGSAQVRERRNVALLGLSGAALYRLDAEQQLSGLVALLMVEPTLKVTRLDLRHDLRFGDDVHGAAGYVAQVHARASQGRVSISRKRTPPEDVRWLLTTRRPAGGGEILRSGTVYIGKSSLTAYAKVYDKRAQMAERHNLDIGEEVIRIEVTAARGRATLRDLIEPDALFFDLAAPDLIARPAQVPAWRKLEMEARKLPPVVTLTEYQRAERLIESSADLQRLSEAITRDPALGKVLGRKILKRLGLTTESDQASFLA